MYLTEDQEKEVTKLEKALIKDGRKAFVQEMRHSSILQLEAKLLSLAKHSQEITNTKNRDGELLAAKQRKSELEAPYREQATYNQKLARFVSLVLKDQEGDTVELNSPESAKGVL